MFVESHGADRARLEEDLRDTLTTVIVHRPVSYDEIESEIVGIECRYKPVCALAVAVYKSEGWYTANGHKLRFFFQRIGKSAGSWR